MDVERICAEYLRSVSPIAQRIAEDIDSVRYAYKDLWDQLDSKDKNQVVDEALIDPAAVVKYANEKPYLTCDLEPLSNFSWFTQSQLNLFTYLPTHVCEKLRSKRTPIKSTDVFSPNKKRLVSPLPHHGNANGSPQERVPAKVRQPSSKNSVNLERSEVYNEISGNLQKGSMISKPKNPPPPPPPKSARSDAKAMLEQDDIPKTGFDFLDNW